MEYKYLGITINSKNCSFIPTLADLGCKGKRTLYAITSKIPLKLVPIKTMFKLFDACVTPILLYGSEIWGAYTNIDHNKWESTPIEKNTSSITEENTRSEQIHYKHSC